MLKTQNQTCYFITLIYKLSFQVKQENSSDFFFWMQNHSFLVSHCYPQEKDTFLLFKFQQSLPILNKLCFGFGITTLLHSKSLCFCVLQYQSYSQDIAFVVYLRNNTFSSQSLNVVHKNQAKWDTYVRWRFLEP